MLKQDTYTSYTLDTLIGASLFFVIVSGSTYFLQSTLVLYKAYGAHAHWAAVLIATPLTAGLLMRLTRIIFPLVSAILGAAASAGLLYPLYKTFWAVPPSMVDLTIYVTVILGIGFIASLPLRTTFMIAFRIGRFSLPGLKSQPKNPARSQTNARAGSRKSASKSRAAMSDTQRLQASDHGTAIAMMELFIGLTSLALSIFSVFFLGRA